MTTATVSQGNAFGLPPALKVAQDAIQFPEVQQMLRKQSGYGLGVFMPHRQVEQTGEFQPLADQFVQVESGLAVSLQATDEVAGRPDRFLPVGWFWRSVSSTASAVCKMVSDAGRGSAGPCVKHKMPEGN